MSDDFIFTSESVTTGHPDKLCDQVSDAIVDRFLQEDKNSGIVAECAVSSGVMFISAHYASQAKPNIPEVARRVIRGVGYSPEVFDADSCTIMTSFMDHSATEYRLLELDSMGDAAINRVTAKHQVTVFGYACDQTAVLMPKPIYLAHRFADLLDSPEVAKELPYLLPDGKAQVAVEYVDALPTRVHSITLVASQTDEDAVDPNQLRDALIARVVQPVLSNEKIHLDDKVQLFVNPEGPLVGGGPAAHSGLTGRKTGIDTYGEYARHSGTSLSGKDPLRIDRVGAYMARYVAKNVVASGLAGECEIQLSYAIGSARPVSLRLRTFGSGQMDDGDIAKRVMDVFDLRLGAVVRDLRLQHLPAEHPNGFYRHLAVYGHMGRLDMDLPWEKTDQAAALK